MNKPELITTFIYIDDRGIIQGTNSLDLSKLDIRRFYIVTNHKQGFIRAFHGHKEEKKYLYVIKGAITVKIIAFEDVELKNNIHTYHLNSNNLLVIPNGYYHGYKNLTQDTIIMVMSNKTLDESTKDDYRLKYDYFGSEIWEDFYR